MDKKEDEEPYNIVPTFSEKLEETYSSGIDYDVSETGETLRGNLVLNGHPLPEPMGSPSDTTSETLIRSTSNFMKPTMLNIEVRF